MSNQVRWTTGCCIVLAVMTAAVRAGDLPAPRYALFRWQPGGSSASSLVVDRSVLVDLSRRAGPSVIEGFPLSSDRRVDLLVEPFTVTGPDTRFLVGRPDGRSTPLAVRPDVHLFRGTVMGHPDSHAFLALSHIMTVASIDLGHGGGGQVFRSGAGLRDPSSVATSMAGGALPPGVQLCGLESLDGSSPIDSPLPSTDLVRGTQTIKLAIETDYEFFELFGDLDAAAAYVVELYAAISDVYLRDVNTRFELTFVRLWDTPADLFNEADPLSSFRDYWNANMGAVDRDLAQFASGRRDLPYGGVAWLSAICSSNGYSVVGYLQGFSSADWQSHIWNYDVRVAAHELGHNCAALHTHDYLIDNCNDLNGVSRRGTIMSYCGQTRSGGNAAQDVRFHAVVQGVMEPYINSVACVIDDCNRNNVSDGLDVASGQSADENGNAVPDECEDCNGNGMLDNIDIMLGLSQDLNFNQIPDDCEADCNGNNRPDDLDIADGTSGDLYGNNIPDECEADCDLSGGSDYNDILAHMTLDVNRDAVLDSCEDCDDDGTVDAAALGGAHNLWVASETLDVVGEFHAGSGVRVKTSDAGHIALGQDVTISPAGLVLVSSALDDRVAAFDPATGLYSHDFVAAGEGGLDRPAGMTWTPDGRLLVSSFLTNSVLSYDGITGAFVGDFVASGSGGLIGPFGLTFGPDGQLFVTSSNNEVLEYDGADGTFIDRFVKAEDNGGLNAPRGLTFKRDGNLLVVSYNSNALLEYDGVAGAFVGKFNHNGTATALTMERPWGVRIGPNGNVFVSRSGAGAGAAGDNETEHLSRIIELHLNTTRIFEFDVRNGNFVRSYVLGNDSDLILPTGIAFRPGWDTDCNLNSLPDTCDVASGYSLDQDGNGVPDECDVDCNGNARLDRLDIIPFGHSFDCNGNGTPDECDIAGGASTDINGNGRPDECEGILAGDLDEDGDLDLLDFAAFIGCVTGPGGGGIDTACDAADFDNDDDVDMADYSAFQERFTG